MGGIGSEIPNEVGVSAEVVPAAEAGDQLVTLYSAQNHELQVKASEVDFFLGQGFRRAKFDIPTTLSEFLSYCDTAKQAVQAFVDGVVRDGFIDPEDESQSAAAERAVGMVVGSFTQLYNDINFSYKVRGNLTREEAAELGVEFVESEPIDESDPTDE